MQIVSLRRRANDLQRDPASLQHVEHARDAFATAANVSRWIQERNVPTAESAVDEFAAAALDLDSAVPLLEQSSRILAASISVRDAALAGDVAERMRVT